ncbi:MAG: 3-methyl-2-oxobutanoate dehydrogenase subunit VorB [Candidatus Omnitrophica bacterium]|nr:3-methyl-2-oxobutanoate dehydrogenase subunit VorB [Candidatus Omnitrophota bacterium]MDD5488222.1 3-methyl-2-oxobutanoate dehydrogenase subunit VorB [Candidatus Omnitrophota bacterium]
MKYLSTGNEACGEGAIRAGCRFYAGYPITPQNELTAYMARRMEETDGVFIQAESELAAINMVFGASAAGARAMTSSSSPGISLKQEGISYMAGAELPGVIVNVMRGGPGLGNIAGSQADYFQATKGGGHGDYRMIVLAPSTGQEMFDLTYEAFALADRYNNPVMVLADGMLGQMMEPIEFDDNIKPSGIVEKPWAMTGAKGRAAGSIKSLLLKDGVLEEHNKKLQEKYTSMAKEVRCETVDTDGADVILVAYGSMARIARECMGILAEHGIRAGLIRPVTLWPFPYDVIRGIAAKCPRFFVTEMSAGQMVEDVRLAVQDDSKVSFCGRMGGGVPSVDEITEQIIGSGKKKI